MEALARIVRVWMVIFRWAFLACLVVGVSYGLGFILAAFIPEHITMRVAEYQPSVWLNGRLVGSVTWGAFVFEGIVIMAILAYALRKRNEE